MLRLIVTGASGLLGNWIIALAKTDYLITPTDIVDLQHSNFAKADITDANVVRALFHELKPDVVIHTASETNVDRCETEKERAWKINAVGTRNVAEACQVSGAMLVCISTDYVFGGEKSFYTEEDVPNPIDFYGLTKLEGEKQAMVHCKKCAVLRASVLYGRHPTKQDFVTWIINKLNKGQEISVVDDHFNTPTLAENLARMALEVGSRGLQGIYHTSGCERISRYDFARKIAEVFRLDASLINPVKMGELKAWIAKRPRDSSLNTQKAQGKLRIKPLNINEGLGKLKEEMKA